MKDWTLFVIMISQQLSVELWKNFQIQRGTKSFAVECEFAEAKKSDKKKKNFKVNIPVLVVNSHATFVPTTFKFSWR